VRRVGVVIGQLTGGPYLARVLNGDELVPIPLAGGLNAITFL